MKIGILLGVAAAAGAVYFCTTDKGKDFVNQSQDFLSGWLDKGGETFNGIAEKVKSTISSVS